MNTRAPLFLTLTVLLLVAGARAQAADALEKGFDRPPLEARPWVYWFWLNGNISSNGITADLEAMKRVGIGGVLIMEVDQGAPVGPVDFMSARWRDLFRHVVTEARRLGLEVNLNNDAGWNGSGGPWIKPEQSMQEVTWSETNLVGPIHFEGGLRQPDTVAGFYRDIAVQAFPAVGDERIPNFEAKAAFQKRGRQKSTDKDQPPPSAIEAGRVVDLSARMDASGRLAWDVPDGTWTVARFGHTSTGVENAPAPTSGRGLECDKLSREGIEANFAGMMAKLTSDNRVRPGAKSAGLVATHIDSWENGSQNWTARMREEFRARRGYDLTPFLPVFTGRVVTTPEVSERFLWDLRQTVSELVIENYAGRMRDLAHAHGLRFTVEAYGSPCDFIPYAGESDEPMGEFWTPGSALETCRGMASAGHVYGKRIIGAEAFTAGDQERWKEHPATLKALGDQAFCEGINRFVFHRYALQPWTPERRPGMTMGPWGQHYERTETWWEWSRPWHEYLARCQFLLRQGRFVADICYLQAEAPPQGFSDHPRRGYGWDQCGADVVLHRMAVKDGRLVLPDGMSYRVLVLPDTRTMTPTLLRKIKELVEAGATVIGTPPQQSPGLSGYPDCDAEVRRFAAELWGEDRATSGQERRVGQGRVYRATEPEKVLRESGVPEDSVFDQPMRSLHRALDGADVYFVANPAPRHVTVTGTFRVRGRIPELWWPESGRREPAPVFEERGDRTSVALALEPSGSVFVVFRNGRHKNDPVQLLTRDGLPVLSARAKPPLKIAITRASYGPANDPSRARDVRDLVQQKVDAGETSFAALAIAQAGDPAPGVVKTLVVDYAIEGKSYSVKAQDPATVHITPEALKITVEQARYGVLDDPKRTRDVRDKLQQLVDAGESSFQVARMAAGDDPAFLVVKTLEVAYTRDGQRGTARGTDPDIIDLKPTPADAVERIAEVQGNGRRTTLLAFQPGRYELTTAEGRRQQVAITAPLEPVELKGPWTVRFVAGWGAPTQATFETLHSWSRDAEPGIRYYSGVASYSTSFSLARDWPGPRRRVFLDLGRVEVMADVKLNGKPLGLRWKSPFRWDITEPARAGENRLEVAVVNLWPNRLVGDEQLPEDSDRNPDGTLKGWPAWLLTGQPSPAGRVTFTTWRLWKKTDTLLESGLLGPVHLQPAEEAQLR